MSLGLKELRDAYAKNYGTSLSSFRTVHTSTQSVTQSNRLPRYTRGGGSGGTLLSSGGSVSMYNLGGTALSDNHGLWMDAIQWRVGFLATRYDNITGDYYYAPTYSWLANNTNRSISVSGLNSGRNSWTYLKEGSTNLIACRGWYDNGRYYTWGAWYGSANFERIYYYVYRSNEAYPVAKTTSTTLAGSSNANSLSTVSNSYFGAEGGTSGSYQYSSFLLKNRRK